MFSTEEFIEASRKFVCVRIETYENKESEQLVKKVLGGRYANTAFVILNPQATRPLTRSGRSPGMAMTKGRKGARASSVQPAPIISQMNEITEQFRPNGDLSEAELQDFHSLRQALNCASADQRLLVFVNASSEGRDGLDRKLKSVFSDQEVIGKFHLDFASEKSDAGWLRVIRGAEDRPSIMVVRTSQFGLDGDLVAQLSLDADASVITRSLLAANAEFARSEKRKNHEQHVREGRRQRVSFENEIPRNGSDSVDSRAGRRGR